MIAQKSRSLEWIREAATKNHAPDIILVEKTIRAFSLLESLALSGLDFCFTPGFSISRKTKNVFEDVTIGDIDFTDARFEVRGGQNYSPEM